MSARVTSNYEAEKNDEPTGVLHDVILFLNQTRNTGIDCNRSFIVSVAKT
jgi:hypothetical protein